MKGRRSRRRMALFRRWGAAASMAVAVALGASQTARGVIGTMAHDAAALLDGRSPGARDSGVLVQTKLARRHAAPGPHQRVLSNERSRPGGAPAGVPADEPAGAPAGGGGDFPYPALGGGVPGLGGGQQPLSGSNIPPAGGQPFVVNNSPPISPPEAAVPEPDTYGLLALGIGLIGAMQRRRRRLERKGGARPESDRCAAR